MASEYPSSEGPFDRLWMDG